MKEIEAEDMIISVSAAEMFLSESQVSLVDRHQEIFNKKLGDVDPKTNEAMKIYYQTMEQVKGVREVYNLIDQLTDFNLNRLLNSKEN